MLLGPVVSTMYDNPRTFTSFKQTIWSSAYDKVRNLKMLIENSGLHKNLSVSPIINLCDTFLEETVFVAPETSHYILWCISLRGTKCSSGNCLRGLHRKNLERAVIDMKFRVIWCHDMFLYMCACVCTVSTVSHVFCVYLLWQGCRAARACGPHGHAGVSYEKFHLITGNGFLLEERNDYCSVT